MVRELFTKIKRVTSEDKINSIASQFAIQKWPSCYTNLKCIATSYDASLLQLLFYIDCLFMFLTL